jgi:hypothetical protein
VLVAAVLCASALPAGARATPQRSVFDGAGVFVDSLSDFPGPWTLADELQAAHFSWVAFRVDDAWAFDGMDPMWIDVFRAHGLSVGAWGKERANVATDVGVADLAIKTYGFDFYLADAEVPFESPTDGVAWRRSAEFVRAFRQLWPDLPAGLVTLGAAPPPYVLPLDYAAWRAGGFELLPEAYYNQYPKVLRPDMTVAHALRAGWSPDQVHPVIGVYHHYPAAKYVPLLQRDGARGFSVFLADQATAGDFAALSQLAAATLAG